MNSPAARLALLIPILFIGLATTFGILWYWIQFNPADSAYWLALADYILTNQSIPTPFKISLPAGFGVALILALSTRFIGKSSDYGDSRSASRRDIRRAGLKDQPGVVCGAKGQRLLAFDAPRTAAVIAPAGAGKSVGIINPTVVNLSATVSAIIHDPKDEIRQATSAWRSKVSHVYRFSPTDPTSDPWNPLNDADLPENPGDLQSYIDMLNAVLFPAEGENSETHWKLAAAAATKAATLFNIFDARSSGRSTSYAEIYSWFAQAGEDSAYDDSKDPVRDWLSDKANEATSNNWPASIADGLNLLALKADRERASVISTAVTRLEMFANENVAKMTSESAFSLKDVREAKTPVTIYMHLPENVRKSMGRLTGLFLQCLANQILSYPEHVARSLNPVCFILDELPALPPVEAIEALPARGRGLGVWPVFAAQSYSQIYDAFGRDRGKVITDLFTYLIVLQLNSRDTQEEISAVIGDYTRERTSYSHSSPLGSNALNRMSEQTALEGARLIRPEELGNLKIGEAIVSVQGFKTRPIRCNTAYHVRRIRGRLTTT